MHERAAQQTRSAVEETVAITGRVTGEIWHPSRHAGRPRQRVGFSVFPASSTGDLAALPRPLVVQVADMLAQDVEATLRAGDRVVIVGRLRTVTWQTGTGTECRRTLLVGTAVGLSVEDVDSEVVA